MTDVIELPRLVLVVDQITRERLAYDDRTGLLDRHGVEVVPLPLPSNAPDWQRALDRRGQLIENVALVSNPMRSGDFIPIEEADIRLAQSKAIVFSQLCNLLGATSVTATMIQKDDRTRRKTVKVAVNKVGGPTGAVSVDDEAISKVAASLNLKDSFTGGPADIEAAKKLLTVTGLDGDHTFDSLVESRANPSNTHLARELQIDLSSEAVRTISAVASVTVPAIVKLNVDFKSVEKKAHRFTVTYKVTFSAG